MDVPKAESFESGEKNYGGVRILANLCCEQVSITKLGPDSLLITGRHGSRIAQLTAALAIPSASRSRTPTRITGVQGRPLSRLQVGVLG
jgi:hypothetical protein